MAAAGARLSPGGSAPAPVRSAGGPAPPEPGAGWPGGARAGRVRTRRPHLPRDRRAAEAGNSADRHRMQRAAGASSHAASGAAAVPGPATAAPAPGGPSRHHRGRGRGGARRDPGRRVRRGLGWVTARGRGRGTGARYLLGVVPSGDPDTRASRSRRLPVLQCAGSRLQPGGPGDGVRPRLERCRRGDREPGTVGAPGAMVPSDHRGLPHARRCRLTAARAVAPRRGGASQRDHSPNPPRVPGGARSGSGGGPRDRRGASSAGSGGVHCSRARWIGSGPGGRVRSTGPGPRGRLSPSADRPYGHARVPNGDQTMKLARLELSGFKSFAVPVELAFDEGVTAVVGPNGCGKSNISDAVRWVLGEQRTRLLRGLRMEDVIFHGSVKRKPVSLAEVSLIFDNGDGGLPIAYHEVAITRRLTRSGLSEYLINQSPVRLRDVQDLLRGTGLGSDAGVVMEAGMIERLLSDRAEERRSLFEEAAGIGLYRDRKTSTERRLEKTAEDLVRLEDLIAEVQTQARSLARQRGKAERHRQFSDERFAIVMTLARHDLAALDAAGGGAGAERQALSLRAPAAQEQLAARERQRETRVQARATAEARRAEVERRLAAAQLEVGRLEGDARLAGERLDNAAQRHTRAQVERDQAREVAQQASRERDAAAQERAAAETARRSVQTELDLRTASEDPTRHRLAAQRDTVRQLEDALQDHGATERALHAEQGVVEREMADLKEQEADLVERLAQAERECAAARAKGDEARRTMAAREREQHEATGEHERARHELSSRRESEAALRVELRAADEAQAQAVARRDALAELERERVGLAPAARQLMQVRDTFGPGAVLGPLSDFVRTSTASARQIGRPVAGLPPRR